MPARCGPEAIYLKLGGADGGGTRQLKFKDAALRRSRREPFRGVERACSTNSRTRGRPYLFPPVPEICRRAARITTISPASRNGRRPAARRTTERGAMSAADAANPLADAARATARLRPRELGLGFRQRGLGQDARAGRSACCACCSPAPPPSRILCLTFTKAAAANMSTRVFKELGEVDDGSTDEALAGAIVATGRRSARCDGTGLRAQTVRAHHRNAGRAEDSNDPRLLRAGAAYLSVRGQRSRGISRSRRAGGRRSSQLGARRRRLSRRSARAIWRVHRSNREDRRRGQISTSF